MRLLYYLRLNQYVYVPAATGDFLEYSTEKLLAYDQSKNAYIYETTRYIATEILPRNQITEYLF
jgi:hypothetical protein